MPSDKKTARKNGLLARSLLSDEQRRIKDRKITARVIEKIAPYQIIGCYVSMRDEVSTIEILQWCFDHDKQIAVPKVTGNTLVFHRIREPADLAPGTFGVLEPVRDDPVAVEDIGFMIVPLSAFDEHNNRTGYGRGYYDSVLSAGMDAVGIIFRGQLVDRIDADPWDVKLSRVITG